MTVILSFTAVGMDEQELCGLLELMVRQYKRLLCKEIATLFSTDIMAGLLFLVEQMEEEVDAILQYKMMGMLSSIVIHEREIHYQFGQPIRFSKTNLPHYSKNV
jgi:hypothetical protein